MDNQQLYDIALWSICLHHLWKRNRHERSYTQLEKLHQQISTTDNKCRLCKKEFEDVTHILCNCSKMPSRYHLPLRHNVIGKYVYKKSRKYLIVSCNHFHNFETCWCFAKLSFHHKWTDGRLLLINMVFTSYLMSCQMT